ncbi:trypsin-like peptidase domain-containing protein [Streptomyces sp. NRRL S-118]|uniref:nSTAND1 domain-containing NTPase n=1 Tax=Streptomyces sp. NRRL S-118 TaxID=1463881 RepID=UPI0004CB183D|nr:trypsin-like peptidase domain-containing protein [Streptomyces sp. NRRL S-118]
MPGSVPNPGIARIWSRGAWAAPQGAGFLVGPRTVLTCAHVVSAVAGEPEGRPLEAGFTVDLDFPLTGPAVRRRTARLVTHVPVGEDHSGDIALLTLDEDPPPGAGPVRLLDVESVRGHPFRAFGFPAGDDAGVWSLGTIVDDRGRGWLQFESTSACEIRQGFSGTPLWDDRHQGVVGMVVATDGRFLQRAAYAITAAVLFETHPVLRHHAALPSPFRGLEPYREQDAAHYFGRPEQIMSLTEAVTTSSIVPVIGVSGVGKSSLLHAGLVPALRRRGDYSIASLVPDPTVSAEYMLASALLPLLDAPAQQGDDGDQSDDGDQGEPAGPGAPPEPLERLERLAGRLREGAAGPAVRALLTRAGTAQLLLIIDQFEVLFRCSPEAADALVEQVVTMTGWRTADGGPLVRLVFGLRLDFLKAMRRFPVLERVCESSPVLVDRLGEDRLREVVLSPVAAFHGAVRFEDRLPERLVSDAGRSPGALPLLAFALSLLWERQRRGILGHAAYEDIGGVAGALATHAERIVKERLGDVRDDARRLLVQLVRPGDGGLDRPVDTGRTARRRDLPAACWQAAQLLAFHRLVHLDRAPDGAETVALAHEALLEHWPTLRAWVDQDRSFRSWQEHLRERIARWEHSGRDHALLMRGSELRQARQWLLDRSYDIPDGERAYVRAGLERRRRRWSRRAAAGTAVAAVLGTLAGAGLESVRDSKAAELSAGLVHQAQREADTHRERAALLSVAAWRTAPTQQARDNLFARYLADAPFDAVLPAGGEVAQTALDDSGRVVAVRTVAGRVSVWRAGAAGGPSLIAGMDGVSAVAVSPDGARLALGGDGNRVTVRDLRDGRTVLTLRSAPSTASTLRAVDELRFDRTGRRLLVHPPQDDTAQVWDLDRPTARPVSLEALEERPASGFAFTADGTHVVASDPLSRGAWDTRTGRLTAAPGFHEPGFAPGPRPVRAACADGRWRLSDVSAGGSGPRLFSRLPCTTRSELAGVSDRLVLTRDDGAVTVHDTATGQPLTALAEDGPKGRFTRYSLAAASRRIAFARGAEVLLVTAPPPGSLDAAGMSVWGDAELDGSDADAVHFSPSGRHLVTVGVGGAVAVWDPATGRRVAAAGTGGYPTRAWVAFDAAERTLAVREIADESVTLYRLPSLQVLRRVRIHAYPGSPPHDVGLAGLGFTRSGRLVALAGGAVSQWDTTTGRQVGGVLLFREDAEADRRRYATSLAVDPAAERIAVTTPDLRGVEVWDLRERRRLTVLVPGFRAPLADRDAVRFSEDGRRLLLAGKDGGAEVWEAGGGRREAAVPADSARTTSFLNGTGEVVSVRPGAVERWGPGGLTARIRIPDAARVRAVVPSPDGERLLLSTPLPTAWGRVATFRRRETSAGAWAAGLCSRVTRNISREDLITVRYGMLERNLLGVTACGAP